MPPSSTALDRWGTLFPRLTPWATNMASAAQTLETSSCVRTRHAAKRTAAHRPATCNQRSEAYETLFERQYSLYESNNSLNVGDYSLRNDDYSLRNDDYSPRNGDYSLRNDHYLWQGRVRIVTPRISPPFTIFE